MSYCNIEGCFRQILDAFHKTEKGYFLDNFPAHMKYREPYYFRDGDSEETVLASEVIAAQEEEEEEGKNNSRNKRTRRCRNTTNQN